MHRSDRRLSSLYGSFRWLVPIWVGLVAGPSLGIEQIDVAASPIRADLTEEHRVSARLPVRPDTSIRPARVGTSVPEFEVEYLRDSTRTFSPSDFDGRYVLLNLWATWCAPCVEKIPTLRTARQRYADETLAILNVSFDRERSAARDMLNERDVPGRHAFVGISALGGDIGAKFARMPQQDASRRALPNLTLIGPSGEVLERIGPLDGRPLLDILQTHLP